MINKWDSNKYPATNKRSGCGVVINNYNYLDDLNEIVISNLYCSNIYFKLFAGYDEETDIKLLQIITVNDMVEVEIDKIVSINSLSNEVTIETQDLVSIVLKFANKVEFDKGIIRIQKIVDFKTDVPC